MQGMDQPIGRPVFAYFFLQPLTIWLVTTALAIGPPASSQDNKPSNAVTQSQQEIGLLAVGKPIERELEADETHVYRIRLAAQQFLRVVVDQRGIDVAVALFGPDRKQIIEVDSPNGAHGLESIS